VSEPVAPAGPLAGRTIAVTRAREQATDLVDVLARLGAVVIEAPAVRFEDPPDWAPLDAALDTLAGYDWLVLTSANTLPRVLSRMRARGLEPAALRRAVEQGLLVAAVGPGTAAALEPLGFPALVLPETYRAEGLVAALQGRDWQGVRVFLPRAYEAREELPAALRARGAHVDAAPAYRTVASPEGVALAREALEAGRLDAVTLTSGAIARAFVQGLGPARDRLATTALVSIGPVTTEALHALGLAPAAQARSATVPGLVAALVEHFHGPLVGEDDTSDPGDLA
jgi:uroporphyrinogen III methyltransferase/synthase